MLYSLRNNYITFKITNLHQPCYENDIKIGTVLSEIRHGYFNITQRQSNFTYLYTFPTIQKRILNRFFSLKMFKAKLLGHLKKIPIDAKQ